MKYAEKGRKFSQVSVRYSDDAGGSCSLVYKWSGKTCKSERGMINWDNFYVFAAVSVGLWLAGAVFALRSSMRSRMAVGFTVAGIMVLGIFIAGLWEYLQRPPLRTMGETRLWYSFFMGIAGLLTYMRWRYRWILSFSTLLSTVFVVINLLKPEIHDQSLMPALQSVWFIPHVTVYMFSYSVLGLSLIHI